MVFRKVILREMLTSLLKMFPLPKKVITISKIGLGTFLYNITKEDIPNNAVVTTTTVVGFLILIDGITDIFIPTRPPSTDDDL